MNEELKKLFEGSELSDEFKAKVTELYEAAIADAVEKAKEQLVEEYDQKSKEYAEYVVSEMEDKTQEYIQTEVVAIVEKYLDYATQEHFKETEQVVESQIKVELADQFLKGFVGLAEGYNVVVPEGQDNLVEELQQKLDKMQERFDSILEENKSLQEEIVKDKMADIVDAKVSELTESQKEKFYATAAKVKFQDEDQYKQAIDELYESYFPVQDKEDKKVALTEQAVDTETVNKVSDKYLDSLFSKF